MAIETACAVWAIHRRALDIATLGDGIRPLVERILPVLPIGTEGQRIFDLGQIVDILKADSASPGRWREEGLMAATTKAFAASWTSWKPRATTAFHRREGP